ncbi:plastocyanin/azurin family copper-binding protein [Haloglomus salinum]|uniref:plastocyanin/azurin family copper-binding protein n=1 Tax=Haloglomus salinum TaxID=2962673 RepID=UPI0020C98448|nr:plastocyanin/azurin family copper-binding protein [Haloglomus salinum]
MERRRFLRAAAAAGIPVTLAGCTNDGGDGGGDGGSTPTATYEPTATPTEAMGTTSDQMTPTATDTATPTDKPTATESPTPTGTPTPVPDMEVTVAPSGNLRFDPASFTISAGDTVLWTWDGSGHNVKPDGIPSDADWTGTPGDNLTTYGSDYSYVYTFDIPGSYDYKCIPHQSSGMTASFTVE